MPIGDIRQMADEVAELMALRFGGARRGQSVDLQTMMRRRGGALPRKLRKEMRLLAKADSMAGAPKLARQVDEVRVTRAHRALIGYLRPLGQVARWQSRVTATVAAVVLGLMLIAAAAIWIMVLRGHF